ncbi:MAG TPA: carbonic anhydrase [Polyangiaceae bacterium]|jgi:carbonic anhydrase
MPRTFAPDAVPPEEALSRLRDGNRRFVLGDGNALRRWHPGLADQQTPFAVVLGCADSRAPAEYVFDQGLGDLFVIRVAGNIIAPSLVGSVEFAASQFGTRLVVVMGHTHCGAVAATMTPIALEGGAASRNLRSIVDRITPHVRHLFDAPGDNATRLAAAVRANAEAAALELRHASPALQDLVDRGRVVIVSAVYDLETGGVTFHDPP